MGRGRQTPDETIEQIKATFSETGSYDAAAKAAGVSWATAQKYADSKDEFETLRVEKRIDIIEKIKQVQIILLDAIVDPATLSKASMQEKSVAFGIVTDKGQLLSGEPTERHEHRDISEARDEFARRIDELAERRRARGADLGVRTG